MSVTLETLELTRLELESAKNAVRKLAYFNWLDAGCPEFGELEFWLKAEREWIQRDYVPHRTVDGTRSQPNAELAVLPPKQDHQETAPVKSRRHRRVRVTIQ